MSKVRVLTDSSAHFEDPALAERLGISIIPLTIEVGGRTYRDGVDLNSETFFSRVFPNGHFQGGMSAADPSQIMPHVRPPGVADFAARYSELGRTTDQILSLHHSSKLTDTYAHAKQAMETLLGRCQIVPVDSMTTSFGLGVLAEAAAKAAEQGKSLDEIVRIVRGMIPRIYSVFFVESLEFLQRGGRIGRAQSILGTMLGIKLFLTIEDGELIPMEKVRSREKGIEKLVEFVSEFSCIERVAILQTGTPPAEETTLLLDRLAAEFPARKFPVLQYGPALASIFGPHSIGVVVYEGVE